MLLKRLHLWVRGGATRPTKKEICTVGYIKSTGLSLRPTRWIWTSQFLDGGSSYNTLMISLKQRCSKRVLVFWSIPYHHHHPKIMYGVWVLQVLCTARLAIKKILCQLQCPFYFPAKLFMNCTGLVLCRLGFFKRMFCVLFASCVGKTTPNDCFKVWGHSSKSNPAVCSFHDWSSKQTVYISALEALLQTGWMAEPSLAREFWWPWEYHG